ncbi:Chs5p-Arf1p-binding proteins-domain-containing protein [Armillaria luteobubalina]|uniref:Chs5p-Arf1p-binding proteins-domain-containing protein n=1 Tax=Armillaria luteobubalina TaxID=153913 RepID=A0AA39Q1P7_9AGAR|nr:Chs5p-Arf1p-binding proteins-domain-containing protein [Armillaria luteobubalina]
MSHSIQLGSYHYIPGVDASSSASLAAYINSLTYAIENSSAWFTKTAAWKAGNRCYCCFNAFSCIDIHVNVKIPGGVNTYAIDLRGERHEVTLEIWKETYMSLDVYCPLDPITSLEAEIRFLQAAESLSSRFWAVLIGINEYASYPLQGSVPDVWLMEKYLTEDLGMPSNHIQLLFGSKDHMSPEDLMYPSCAHIVNTLLSLTSDPEIVHDDNIIIYYSGYGSYYLGDNLLLSKCSTSSSSQEIAGDVIQALTLSDRNVHVPNLEILHIEDVPCSGWQVGSNPKIQVATIILNQFDGWDHEISAKEPEVASLLAQSYIGMNKGTRTVQIIVAAMKETPQSYTLLHVQCDFLHSKGKFKWALKLARQAVNCAPSKFMTWGKLMELYLDLGQFESALLTLNSCPMFTFNGRDAYWNLTPSRVHLPFQ